MPNQIAITVGPDAYAIPIKLTNARLKALIKRNVTARGIAPLEAVDTGSLTERQLVERLLRSILRDMRDVSTAKQRAELLAVQQAALETTLAQDNDLYDEA